MCPMQNPRLPNSIGRVSSRPRWIGAYYLATPLFAIADWLGADVRAVGLAAHPGLRLGYYLLFFLAGGVLQVKPSWSAPIGLIESSVNVFLLILSVVLPYYDQVRVLADGDIPADLPMSLGFLVNFLISGGVWVLVFERSRLQLREGRD